MSLLVADVQLRTRAYAAIPSEEHAEYVRPAGHEHRGDGALAAPPHQSGACAEESRSAESSESTRRLEIPKNLTFPRASDDALTEPGQLRRDSSVCAFSDPGRTCVSWVGAMRAPF